MTSFEPSAAAFETLQNERQKIVERRAAHEAMLRDPERRFTYILRSATNWLGSHATEQFDPWHGKIMYSLWATLGQRDADTLVQTQTLVAYTDNQPRTLVRLRFRDASLLAASQPETVLAIHDAWGDEKILEYGAPVSCDLQPDSPWMKLEAFLETLRDSQYSDNFAAKTAISDAVEASLLPEANQH